MKIERENGLRMILAAILRDPSIIASNSEAINDLARPRGNEIEDSFVQDGGQLTSSPDISTPSKRKKISLGFAGPPTRPVIHQAGDDASRSAKDEKFIKYMNLLINCDILLLSEARSTENSEYGAKELDALFGFVADQADLRTAWSKIFVSRSDEMEGVTKERSDPVSEDSKLDSTALVPIFEGELSREAVAETLKSVMQQRGLSVRMTAAAAGVGAKEIQRITSGEATIDKGLKVLSELGCRLHFRAEPIEPK